MLLHNTCVIGEYKWLKWQLYINLHIKILEHYYCKHKNYNKDALILKKMMLKHNFWEVQWIVGYVVPSLLEVIMFTVHCFKHNKSHWPSSLLCVVILLYKASSTSINWKIKYNVVWLLVSKILHYTGKMKYLHMSWSLLLFKELGFLHEPPGPVR